MRLENNIGAQLKLGNAVWAVFLGVLSCGCGSPVLSLRSTLTPGLQLTRYTNISVFPVSSEVPEEGRLADEFYAEFVQIGLRTTGRAQFQSAVNNNLQFGMEKDWSIERIRQVARSSGLDALALVSVAYQRGVAWIDFRMFDIETGQVVIESSMQHDTPLAGGLPYRKIASIMMEDIKSKLVQNR